MNEGDRYRYKQGDRQPVLKINGDGHDYDDDHDDGDGEKLN
jgi:hypothetical protein